MGLLARQIERLGIPTVALSIVREITEKTPPPRALFMRWPFGHALGEPLNVLQQRTVLFRAFKLLLEATEPVICDSGLRWRREEYSEPPWKELG